jgi:hypothetical protein
MAAVGVRERSFLTVKTKLRSTEDSEEHHGQAANGSEPVFAIAKKKPPCLRVTVAISRVSGILGSSSVVLNDRQVWQQEIFCKPRRPSRIYPALQA